MRKMYGVLHTPDGAPIVREPRTVKVGIGLAKGKDIHVYIDAQRKWCVRAGKDTARFEDKLEAKKEYRAKKATAPERKYPQRLPYFTFSHVSTDGTFEPDFEAIEQHGPIPTEIDIVFVKDDSFDASYQMWTSTELKCEGDGITASRINTLASTKEEKALAQLSQGNGEKYFPIVNGCWTKGCQYAKPTTQNGKEASSLCKPHGRLVFQLLNNPRLGGTAYFDTTGFRSISQIFSCLQTFKSVTGKGVADAGFVAGIPLKMVLRPYKVVHNGQSGTQYGVSLEFRAESALALKRSLIEQGMEYRLADGEPQRLLPEVAPQVVDITTGEISNGDDTEPPQEIAAAMAAEFPGGATESDDDDFGEPGADTPPSMPRRKSEAAVVSASPSEPPDQGDFFQSLWEQ